MLVKSTCGALWLVVAAAGSAIAGSPVPCDISHQADLERAHAVRFSGDYEDAIRISQTTLSQARDNTRAQYTLGLALLDKASHEKQQTGALNAQALGWLSKVADTVDEESKTNDPATLACLKGEHVFSIMNTLGYLYKDTDPKKSELYLDKSLALDKRGLIEPETRGKTYENLGDLYVQVGDYSTANTFYGEAKASGNQNPDIDRRLSAIHLVLHAQQGKPTYVKSLGGFSAAQKRE